MTNLKGPLLSLLTSTCSSTEHLHQIHALLLLLSPTTPYPWNRFIRGCASRSHPRLALEVFDEMRHRSLAPTELTFPFVLKACASLRDLRTGNQVHADAVKRGSASNVYVGNSLVSFYGSCREISDARKVFDGMPVRSLVSWNAVLTACVENEWLREALLLFSEMYSDSGFEPDATTMVVLLSASAEFGNLSLGRWVHSQMIARGTLEMTNVQLGTSLLNMYAKCGAIHDALEVFDRMPERNVWTWSAMILGLAQHGLAGEALELFSRMEESAVKPNHVTFLGVLCACSHAGMVDEGRRFFHDMKRVHGMEPGMSHYSAMVDVLGRSGHLEEAYRFIEGMPSEPEAAVWRTLLNACSLHKGNDRGGVGEKVRSRLMEMEPRRCGNYVMVANMYADVGSWDEAAMVRRRMREEGLRKSAGESCVEVSGSLHRFASGVNGCLSCGDDAHELLEALQLNSTSDDGSGDLDLTQEERRMVLSL